MASIPGSKAPIAHSPDAAAERLGVPVRKVYHLLAAGELKSFKVGRSRLIPDAELHRLVERKMAEAERGAS
jgi:excisionase family DNA binding protein